MPTVAGPLCLSGCILLVDNETSHINLDSQCSPPPGAPGTPWPAQVAQGCQGGAALTWLHADGLERLTSSSRRLDKLCCASRYTLPRTSARCYRDSSAVPSPLCRPMSSTGRMSRSWQNIWKTSQSSSHRA
eukprot:749883-Hanusia_phi.AAC.11